MKFSAVIAQINGKLVKKGDQAHKIVDATVGSATGQEALAFRSFARSDFAGLEEGDQVEVEVTIKKVEK